MWRNRVMQPSRYSLAPFKVNNMSLLTTLNPTQSAFDTLVRRPSLEVFFDAIASPRTLTTSNQVQQWNDISGNNNHALKVATDPMPTYVASKDGFPSIYSDGQAGRKLDFNHSVTVNDPFTAIALFLGDNSISDPSTGSSLNVVFAFGGADASNNSVALRQSRDNLRDLSFVGYGGGSQLDDSPYNSFETFAISYDTIKVKMHYGNILESGSNYNAAATRVMGTGRLFNESPQNSSRTGIGWLRCMLLYKEALSDTTRNQITLALKQRYGAV